MKTDRFRDRFDAGEQLAEHLKSVLPACSSTLVLGIPRGGVLVAWPVARRLEGRLDVIVPRKLGAPQNPELAIAALAVIEGRDLIVRDQGLIAMLGITETYLAEAVRRERAEIERRVKVYREGRPPLEISAERVLIVDDGIATGLTARAAAAAVSASKNREVIVAAPVAPRDALSNFKREGLRLEVVKSPAVFHAVGEFFDDFGSVEDEAVREVLARS